MSIRLVEENGERIIPIYELRVGEIGIIVDEDSTNKGDLVIAVEDFIPVVKRKSFVNLKGSYMGQTWFIHHCTLRVRVLKPGNYTIRID